MRHPPDKPIARIEKWKEQLLDISLRNRLLNYSVGRRSIPFLYPDAHAMEGALVLGKSFSLPVENPHAVHLSDGIYEQAMLEAPLGEGLRAQLESALRAGRIHARCPKKELQKRLLDIYRAARLSLEEGGANTLYVAVGFLSWFETPTSAQERYAPLLLVPVELTRQSARDRFKLKRIDQEPQINVTLAEKLRKDFGIELDGLFESPKENGGLEASRILALMRERVVKQPRWRVHPDVHLGLFSFTTFLMWRDLEERSDEVMKNDVVRHLALGANSAYGGQLDASPDEPLDAAQPVLQTYCPLDADSSQLTAIRAADRGGTFVLEGPPGTGKSQTITNLIAQCLANDKTLLFVSAKMEALKVVHQRLERVGLGDFCLELHSNKARKKHVVEQLQRSIELAGVCPPDTWEGRATDLEALRQQLNDYVDRLHRPREDGRSFFQAVTRLIGLRDAPEIALHFAGRPPIDIQARDALGERVDRMAAAARALGSVAENPWRKVGLDSWSQSFGQRVASSLEAFRKTVETLKKSAGICAAILLGAKRQPRSMAALVNHRDMARLLLSSPCPCESLLREAAKPAEQWEVTERRLRRWIARGRRHGRLKRDLAQRYTEELLQCEDLVGLHQRFVRWSSFTFVLRVAVLWRSRQALRSYTLQPALPSIHTIALDLDKAVTLNDDARYLADFEVEARRWFGADYRPEDPDWERIEGALDWVSAYQKSVQAFLAQESPGEAQALGDHLLHIASMDRSDQTLGDHEQQWLLRYIDEVDAFAEEMKEIEALLCLGDGAFETDGDAAYLDGVTEVVDGWIAALPQLRDWVHYRNVCAAAVGDGLSPLVDALNGGEIHYDALAPAFERGYSQWQVTRVLESDSVLHDFHSAEHSRKIERFIQLDREIIAASRQMVRARLAARIPSMRSDAPESSSMGILLREIKKKTRHLPIRILFGRIPELVQRLKPCMLMSPLSVAQYLGPDFSAFDVVVFDEASQIPTHDAIGSIARGKQLIVVGDSKQLPPTSFFSKEDDGPDLPDEHEVVELESILDECLAARLPALTLRWHYRSRHEKLIAFSNAHYYDGQLHTFPSAVSRSPALGVSWRHISGGYYDRSKSRTNRAEAEAVVAEVQRLLLDPLQCHRSIGVVTFSVAQQQLIEDLLEEARRSRPEIDGFFGGDVPEPVFVKNLENVQGDERDVMFFSICYGPDEQGKVWLNFGPLNVAGGHRRLNVAITRAREQLIVFSTLRPEQIDLERTNSTGAEHLRLFLEYARRASDVVAASASAGEAGAQGTPSHADLINDVVGTLAAHGWQTHTEVGCSDFRVDIAVLDSDDPGRYVLGIVCDGPHYGSARTARDRERLRHEVLQGLGWALHRLWCTDWWHDRNGQLERICEILAERRQHGNGMPLLLGSNGAMAQTEAPAVGVVDGSSDDGAAVADEDEWDGAPSSQEFGVPYELYATEPAAGSAEDFHAAVHDEELRRQLIGIARVEAPIHERELARRLAALYGISRLTKRVGERVAELVGPLVAGGELRMIDAFCWSVEQHPETYCVFRVPTSEGGDTRRGVDCIALPEIRHCALTILNYGVAMDVQDLIRETAKAFGWTRIGANAGQRIERAISALVEDKQCVLDGTRVRIV